MPFTIVRDDITHVATDAIVNAANERLLMGGGVCGAIFSAAGPRKLQAACNKIGYCATGDAVATPGFALPAKYVIHTVGPVWHGGTHGEKELLASCYRTSLELAKSLKCRSIAFPLISAGIYGYPKREALQVAQEEIRAFLDNNEMDVMLVLFDPHVMELSDDLHLRVARYIDDTYVEQSGYTERRAWENAPAASYGSVLFDQIEAAEDTGSFEPPKGDAARISPSTEPLAPGYGSTSGGAAASMPPLEEASDGYAAPAANYSAPAPQAAPSLSASHEAANERRRMKLPSPLRNLLSNVDAGFSETLLTMIDERGLKDAQVYKRANISRQHFSKMRGNPRYKPTKTTVLALAVALELSLDETCMLLERAGFALSHADRRDIIVEFFIREGIYDVFQINDALFAFDQPLLG